MLPLEINPRTNIFCRYLSLKQCRYCHEHSIRYIIIGKGSNCLFDDFGFGGCVILNRIEFLERKESGIYRVGSGFRFNTLGRQSCIEGFTGLEFATGIPGTVGGAVYMNAGANGQVTKDGFFFYKDVDYLECLVHRAAD